MFHSYKQCKVLRQAKFREYLILQTCAEKGYEGCDYRLLQLLSASTTFGAVPIYSCSVTTERAQGHTQPNELQYDVEDNMYFNKVLA